VDRRAITFRTLAVAAMIVLAIAPEALVHPSFQSLDVFPLEIELYSLTTLNSEGRHRAHLTTAVSQSSSSSPG